MAFDAGNISAEMTLDRSPFQRDLHELVAEVHRVTARPFVATMVLEARDLRRQAETAAREAVAGLAPTIVLRADGTGLREDVRRLAATAVTGLRADIKLGLDDTGFRDDLRSRVTAAVTGMRADVKVGVDATGLREDIRQAIRRATAGNLFDADRAMRIKIGVDIDSTGLREQLERALAAAGAGMRIKVGIDVDPTGLRERIAEHLRQASAGQNAKVGVQVDSSALSGLMSSASGASGALGGLSPMVAGVTAAVLLLGPAVAPVVGLLGTLPGLLVGVGQVAGVAILGFSGIGAAMKALSAADANAGTDVVAAAKRHQAAADARIAATQRVKNAQDSLKAAQEAAADAAVSADERIRKAREAVATAEQAASRSDADSAQRVKDARQALADTQQSVAESIVAAQGRVGDAERSLADAQHNEQQAQEDLTQAREDALQKMEDLTRTVEHGSLSEQESVLRVAEARQRYAQATAAGSKATELQRESARLGVLQALSDLDDVRLRNRRNSEDLAEQQKAGIIGERSYVSALDRVRHAHESVGKAREAIGTAQAALTRAQEQGAVRVAHAQEAVTKAVQDGVRAHQDGLRHIADAQAGIVTAVRAGQQSQEQSARSVAQAQTQVSDAMRALAIASRNTGDQASTSMRNVAKAMAALSPAGRSFVMFLSSLKPQLTDLKATAQAGLLPGVEEGLRRMLPAFPILREAIGSTAHAMGDFASSVGRLVGSAGFRSDLHTILAGNVTAFRSVGDGIVHLISAMGRIGAAAAPLVMWLGRAFDKTMVLFDSWTRSATASGGLARLFTATEVSVRGVFLVLGNLTGAIINVFAGHAVVSAGQGFLSRLVDITRSMREWTASAQGQHVVAEVFHAVYAAVNLAGDAVEHLWRGFQELWRILSPLVPVVRAMVSAVREFAAEHPGLVRLAGTFAAVALVAGRLSPLLGLVTGGFKALIAVMKWLSISLDVVALGALVLGFIYLYNHSKTFHDFVDHSLLPKLRDLGHWIMTEVVPAVERFADRVVAFARQHGPEIARFIGDHLVPIIQHLGDVVHDVARWVGDQLHILSDFWHRHGDEIKQVLSYIWGLVKSDVGGIVEEFKWAWPYIRDIVGGALHIIKDVITLSLHLITDIIGVALDLITGHWGRAWGSVKKLVSDVWHDMKVIVDDASHTIRNLIRDLGNDIGKIWGPLWDGVKKTASSVWRSVSGFFGRMRDDVIGAFKDAATGIGREWDRIKNLVADPIKFVVNTVYEDGIRKVVNAVAGFVGARGLPDLHFAQGGVLPMRPIPGNHDRDTVPFYGTPGEVVVPKPVVNRHGGPDAFMGMLGFNPLGNGAGSGPGHYAAGGPLSFGNLAGLSGLGHTPIIGGPGVAAAGQYAQQRTALQASGARPDTGVLGTIVHAIAHPSQIIGDLKNLVQGALAAVAGPAIRALESGADATLGRMGGMGHLASLGVHKLGDQLLAFIQGKDDAYNAAQSGMLGGSSISWNGGANTIGLIESLARGLPGGNQMQVTSTFRPGGGSYHARSEAVDFSDGTDTPAEAIFARAWAAKYGSSLAELIHAGSLNIQDGRDVGDGMGMYGAATMAGHHNHVHVAISPDSIARGHQGFKPFAAAGGGATDGSQLGNARVIADVARSMGLGRNAVEIALMTSLQESGLKNINYGDRDSLGLFQQRPSQGWGTPAQILDPAYAARKFLEGLEGVRQWQTMAPTYAAQAVQRSAYPLAYAKWQGQADSLLPRIGYDSGGWMPPGVGGYVNATRQPEAVLTGEQWGDVRQMVVQRRQQTDDGLHLGEVVRELRAARQTHRSGPVQHVEHQHIESGLDLEVVLRESEFRQRSGGF